MFRASVSIAFVSLLAAVPQYPRIERNQADGLG
jgi:hypothetical protein